MPLQLEEFEFTQDYFVFKLGNVDVILGVDWLSSLGIIHND